MPELPDITVYIESLAERVLGRSLRRVGLKSPFLLRSVAPPPSSVEGQVVQGLRRLGKRLVFEFEGNLYMVIHLMIAGRLHWRDASGRRSGVSRQTLAEFEFETGTMTMTEAGSKRRASLRFVRGVDELNALDPGGVDPLLASLEEFTSALTRENHTLKRALTTPQLFSGIGNAFSDEILHAARLSPLRHTSSLDAAGIARLRDATQTTLLRWIDRLREERGSGFPHKVTAFRAGMAVHGRFKQPCPVCGAAVQRIVYADNECNYCPDCQTDGRLLADRALSRLLK